MSDMDAATRLAGLREIRRAANDWHDATALWSVQNDLDWLLAYAEGRAESEAKVAALREALVAQRMRTLADGSPCFCDDDDWDPDYADEHTGPCQQGRSAVAVDPGR